MSLTRPTHARTGVKDQLNQVEAALDPHGSVRALTRSLSEQAPEELEGDLNRPVTEEVVMAGARQEHALLGRLRGGEQTPPVGDRHNPVFLTMDDQERRADSVDATQRIEAVLDEELHGKKGIGVLARVRR